MTLFLKFCKLFVGISPTAIRNNDMFVHCEFEQQSRNDGWQQEPVNLVPQILGRKVNSDLIFHNINNPAAFTHSAGCFLSKTLSYLPYAKKENVPKKKLVILGSGWVAINLLKKIDCSKYDVSIVSPGRHFVLTPILTNVSGCSLAEELSLEPVSSFMSKAVPAPVNHILGVATNVNTNTKEVYYKESDDKSDKIIPYDVLAISVGANVNTFNIPGVEENSYFLKQTEDAVNIRSKILDNFQRATNDSLSLTEKKKLLHFVVVGAGPTGVEMTGELLSFIKNNAKKHFPSVYNLAKVSLIEMLPDVLPSLSSNISKFCIKHFMSSPFMCLCLDSRVVGVKNEEVQIICKSPDPSILKKLCEIKGEDVTKVEVNAEKDETSVSVPFGMLIWASGIGQVPFIKDFMRLIPSQSKNRFLTVDAHLAVIGVSDVFAAGDCCVVTPARLCDIAHLLYDDAQVNHLSKAGSDYLESIFLKLSYLYPQLAREKIDLKKFPRKNFMTFEEWKNYLSTIDAAYRPPAPTAQAAKQAGQYLSNYLNQKDWNSEKKQIFPCFCDVNNGALVKIGDGVTVGRIKNTELLGGNFANFLRHGFLLSLFSTMEKRKKYFYTMIMPNTFADQIMRSRVT